MPLLEPADAKKQKLDTEPELASQAVDEPMTDENTSDVMEPPRLEAMTVSDPSDLADDSKATKPVNKPCDESQGMIFQSKFL